MKLEFDRLFNLRPREVKCFPVTVCSDVDATVTATVEGISSSACLSTEGNDYLGAPCVYPRKLVANTPKRLWFYVFGEEKAGTYPAKITIYGENAKILSSEDFVVIVDGEPIGDEQFSDISKLRRLYWLNSDYAINDEVPKPFIPVSGSDGTVNILGRTLRYSESGLFSEIITHFGEDVTLSDEKSAVLSSGMRFEIPGEKFKSRSHSVDYANDAVLFCSENESENFTLSVKSKTEFDGYSSFKLTLTAKKEISISDGALIIPISEKCSKYFMGLGREGGYFNRELDWKWNNELQQDSFWVGDVNAGIRVKLLDSTNYVKPLVNIYYSYKPLNMPESWYNDGLGGIKYENGSFICYSGKRLIEKGESLSFDFEIITTPLKPIDLKKHFGMRIFHKPPAEKIDLNEAKTANVVNIHHGNDLNPYINYPFFENNALREFISDAHSRDMLVKLYYTIRELTVHLPEFRALQDLDDEIFEAPKREVDPNYLWQTATLKWIRENVGENLIPAWRQQLKGEKYKDSFDSSVITDGQSRLCNFYIEGLRHLVEFFEIDGIYVDDVAYDRNTMKRVRKTLDTRPGSLIDFHTWNHYTGRAAFTNCFNLYTELLPYIDKMWVGEGFDYSMPPDYWLVEISGIPFGLMSEMMCEGQPWRGLLFGMTTRLSWVPEADPTNIWELFDKYDLASGKLFGPWDKRNTVSLSSDRAFATLFEVGEKRYIALANWSGDDIKTTVSLAGESVQGFRAPYIRSFQDEAYFDLEISLPKGRGYFLEVIE